MTLQKNYSKIASSLLLVFILFGISLASAATENGYNNDNNLLTTIAETTLIENGYKTCITINPYTTGTYANENGYKLDLSINPNGIGGALTESNYQLDLTPEKTFFYIPDIAVTKLTISKTIVGQGYTLRINATALNHVLSYQTFHITIYVNTTPVKTQTLTLTSWTSKTLTHTWNTTGFTKGNYSINAIATPVPGEADTADNTLTNGWVFVSIAGDVNGDKKVDLKDVFAVGKAYGSVVGDSRYNPNLDINDDGKIDLKDYFTTCKSYGKSW